MSEEWSDWFLHDGRGCPVPIGTWVEVDVYRANCVIVGVGFSAEFRVSHGSAKWIGWLQPIKYRIRKPRGMTILEGLLENQPATVEGVDA